jgi:signal transduction histidine kinase
LGVAVLSRQFFGITRLVRRGLVALVVWMSLIGLYVLALIAVAGWQDRRSRTPGLDPATAIVIVVLLAATFWPLQARLRRGLERFLFHDVYDYQATLRRLSTGIPHAGDLDATAAYVLANIGKTLDLSSATITLDAKPHPVRFDWGVPVRSSTDDLGAGASSFPNRNVPLVVDGVVIGQLLVGTKRHDVEHTAEDLAFVDTLAPLIATTMQNALLVRQLSSQVIILAERQHDLSRLSERLMRVQEDERRRIALDLHDEPLQRAILLARELGEARDCQPVARWHHAIEDVVESLRAICVGLRPAVLDDFGLVAGLDSLATRMRADSDLDIRLMVETHDGADFGRLESDLELALYRVAQEALNNCWKHSRASQITVTLARERHRARLRVVDDGQSSSLATPRDASASTCFGLVGMRERLQRWHGVVRFEQRQPYGSMLTAEVKLSGTCL